MTVKTTLNPAEHGNMVQALEYPEPLSVFVKNEAAISVSSVLASKIARWPMQVKEVRVHIVDPGDAGTGSFTKVLVKKDGTSILAVDAIKIEDDAAADTKLIVFPSTEALSKVDAGQILTIESGDDIGDVMVGLSVEVVFVRRFDDEAAKPIIIGGATV